MDAYSDRKIVLITAKTRLDELIRRYNTEGQAKFYIEHNGESFEDYAAEDRIYKAALEKVNQSLTAAGRLQVVERSFVSNYMFGPHDIVVALGRDGLVANVMKYLDGQQLIGINPDPKRWDGVLLPFKPEDTSLIIKDVIEARRRTKAVTLAEASLNDGQSIIGVNDIFIGCRTHASARYSIALGGKSEAQSSSGIIVSTGLGSTGWLKSILAGAAGISRYCGVNAAPAVPQNFTWDSDYLFFTVREPYPGKSTRSDIVFGKIESGKSLNLVSYMPENGVIFSDGMENDFLQFNSGTKVTVQVAKQSGSLVV